VDRKPALEQAQADEWLQLLTDVSDELLRKLTVNTKQYAFMREVGVQSLIVQPVVSRGQIVAIFNLMYTAESGRRYGRSDPALAEEMAVHAAHIIENARLLRDLRATEARFRVALAAARTAVFEQDSSLRYRWYYNPLIPFTLHGRTQTEAFSPEDAALLTRLKQRVLESGGKATEELEVTLGGESRIYRESVEAMHDHAGRTIGVIGAATDITEEKRTQQQLADALEFRDLMLGVLGHDLRDPLSVVTLCAAAVLRQDLPEATRAKIATIEHAAERMSEMIATLLDFTRMRGERRMPITKVPTDLGMLAREITSELTTTFPDRTLQVDVQGNVEGRWDSARVGQAISNLVANALKHGDPHAPVHLLVDGSGDAVVVTVKNEGPPIPFELRPALFEAFSRGKTSAHGLGLGLFIVKEVAVAHGGTIDVESSAERGTIFTLVLPRS
jgi:signal transduction histidine kinase